MAETVASLQVVRGQKLPTVDFSLSENFITRTSSWREFLHSNSEHVARLSTAKWYLSALWSAIFMQTGLKS